MDTLTINKTKFVVIELKDFDKPLYKKTPSVTGRNYFLSWQGHSVLAGSICPGRFILSRRGFHGTNYNYNKTLSTPTHKVLRIFVRTRNKEKDVQ